MSTFVGICGSFNEMRVFLYNAQAHEWPVLLIQAATSYSIIVEVIIRGWERSKWTWIKAGDEDIEVYKLTVGIAVYRAVRRKSSKENINLNDTNDLGWRPLWLLYGKISVKFISFCDIGMSWPSHLQFRLIVATANSCMHSKVLISASLLC